MNRLRILASIDGGEFKRDDLVDAECFNTNPMVYMMACPDRQCDAIWRLLRKLEGLRHTAGRRLAEAGCSDREVAAILGHRTTAMTLRYTQRADQKRLAKAAVTKLERGWADFGRLRSGAGDFRLSESRKCV